MSSRAFSTIRRRGFARSVAPLPLQIRHYAARAPKVINMKRRTDGRSARRIENNTWPEDLIRTVVSSGALSRLSLADCRVFLDTFVGQDLHLKGEERINLLLQELNMKPVHLTILAKTLMRADGKDRRYVKVATDLLAAAVKVKEAAASMVLAEEGLRLRATHHPNVRDAFVQLESLAESGSAGAMVLLALKHEQSGAKDKALDLARQSLTAGTSQDYGHEALKVPLPPAWKIIARIASQVPGGEAEAFEAIEASAYELDDPEAYYELASKHDPPEGDTYMKHMLKAAASGNRDAAVKVGQRYFQQAEIERGVSSDNENASSTAGRTSPSVHQALKAPMQYSLAEQWFRLALQYGKPLVIRTRTAVLYVLACAATKGDMESCRSVLSEQLQEDRWADSLRSMVRGQTQDSSTSGNNISETIRTELYRADDYHYQHGSSLKG